MASQDYPTVDGDECSWADISCTAVLPGKPSIALGSLEAIKWSSKVDVGESRGTSGGRVMKTTAGSVKEDGSMSLTRSGLQDVLEQLEQLAISAGRVRGDEVIISSIRFDILVQHTPLGETRIFQTMLFGCRYLGDSNDLKQGNDADVIEVTLNPMAVKRKSSTGNWLVLR